MDIDNERDEPPFGLSPFGRELTIAALIVLAVVRLLWPSLGIDVIFLALLGLAVFLLLFDIESVEWLGVRARRRRIAKATADVEATPIPTGTVEASPPPDAAAIREASTHTSATTSYLNHKAVYEDPPPHPLERLLWAYEHIRIELLIIAGNAGAFVRRVEWGRYTMPELIAAVRKTQLLPPQIEAAIDQVRIARNEAVHVSVSPSVVKPASRLALEVWEKLVRIKRNYVRVFLPDLTLYADEEGSLALSERGVMLTHLDDEGRVIQAMVFPRNSEYAAGRFVSWEWDLENVVHTAAWYIDPSTGSPVKAFDMAATFAGREYPIEWGVHERVRQATLSIHA